MRKRIAKVVVVEPLASPFPWTKQVELDGARPLLTIEEDGFAKIVEVGPLAISGVDGAIVRVKPSAGASDEQVAKVKALLTDSGAEAVRVMPRARAAVASLPPKERPAPKRHREVVLDMAREMNGGQELVDLVTGIMDEVGL